MSEGTLPKTFFKHPLQMLSVFSMRNARVFFAMARENGFGVAVGNMFRVLNNSASDINRMNSIERIVSEERSRDRIEIPQSENPVVSIIIPVYNQFDYTYGCVRSIAETVVGIDYEIIIADDCSTDETASISDYFPGIRVVKNDRNLRFTLNCNNASKHARGKYLVFLNNDTVVKERWLESLLDLMESDPTVGLAGSKLLYPDGILQEAGCIVWNDGTAWAYGKGMNPKLPEFNYVKDVDYVSGASIMVRADVWKELAGFDERYAPSYCEDSDLAFQIRALGYRTVYQPKSRVVHFEGISNGKAVNSGLKQYQIVNIRKLRDKWNDVLHFSNPHGKDAFTARDRSQNKKHLLFADFKITPADGDDYDRNISETILSSAGEGVAVHMIGDDFLYSDYAPMYQNAGIEVLYGGEARKNLRKWARLHGKNIDTVVVCRPELYGKYRKLFRNSNVIMLDEYVDNESNRC